MILILKRPSQVAAKTLTGLVAGTTDTVFHDCRIINIGSSLGCVSFISGLLRR